MHSPTDRPFSLGTRPVIRWVKGDGLDDQVTRSAIAQATRLFGDRLDYCLTINGVSMTRARDILAWATQPVEIWSQDPADNPELAALLKQAGCPPERFGYWWKWFPERVRPAAPEWILDGDMVIVRKPCWFEEWAAGTDQVRLSQDPPPSREEMYGAYHALPDERKLYSGLLSLPPGYCYLPRMLAILRQHPLPREHDGRRGMEEQGCIAAAFAGLALEPIPLHEFPFARSFTHELRFGATGRQNDPWGYHFSYAFREENAHFRELVRTGAVYWQEHEPNVAERCRWLQRHGEGGAATQSLPSLTARVDELARAFADRRVLQAGTSRGYLAAILATNGCRVTTVDTTDQGAGCNLEGLGVEVVEAELPLFLHHCRTRFDLMVLDVHEQPPPVWQRMWPLLHGHLEPAGCLLLYNSQLEKQPPAETETGLQWVLEILSRGWEIESLDTPSGMILCRLARWNRRFSRFARRVVRTLPGGIR
jgi:hypothetical protein